MDAVIRTNAKLRASPWALNVGRALRSELAFTKTLPSFPLISWNF